MDDGALQALIAVLQRYHPLHVRRGRLHAAEDERDGTLHQRLAPLRREIPQHLLLWGEAGVGREGSGQPCPATAVHPPAMGARSSPTFSSSCSDTSMTTTDTFCS